MAANGPTELEFCVSATCKIPPERSLTLTAGCVTDTRVSLSWPFFGEFFYPSIRRLKMLEKTERLVVRAEPIYLEALKAIARTQRGDRSKALRDLIYWKAIEIGVWPAEEANATQSKAKEEQRT
jgi:hypothetical protein